jgi:hypothetical protein
MGTTDNPPSYGQRPQGGLRLRISTGPYSGSKAACPLGCIREALERHHQEPNRFQVGRQIFDHCWTIGRLVAHPDGERAQPPGERALALPVTLPALSTPAKRLRVAQPVPAPVGGLS